MHIVRKESFTTAPWKNGGGVTHEAVRVPPAPQPYRWRLSVAEIREDGPFSDFRGYRRHMALLRGAGLGLSFENGRVADLAVVGDLVEFDGAAAPQCRLTAGACVDLNLITAHSITGVQASVLRLGEMPRIEAGVDRTVVLFCIEGALVIAPAAQGPAGLAAWDVAVLGGADLPAVVSGAAAAGPPPLVFIAAWNDGAGAAVGTGAGVGAGA
jgi:environmental stress-induced protein Ves